MPDSNSRKGEVLTQVLEKMLSGQKIAPSEFQDFVKAQNEGATTGLQVGEKIPDFALTDQNGNQRKFRDLNRALWPSSGLQSKRRLVTLL